MRRNSHRSFTGLPLSPGGRTGPTGSMSCLGGWSSSMPAPAERFRPPLFGGPYRIPSQRTTRYNCIAWAANDSTVWWEAGTGAYWRAGALRSDTVEAAILLFESPGYTRTDNAELEDGMT